MRTWSALVVVFSLVAFGPALSAMPIQAPIQAPVASAATPAGKWTMSLDTPHGLVVMTFDLKLTSETVSGTMTSDMTGTVAVTGTFTDGKVALTVDSPGSIAFHFTFKDKDTMTGNLSSQMGDMACVASRPKDGGDPIR